ncbi:hypothetical protein HZA57_07210 [Candidatus Poribacteria bacterium]|nr:hypothetical protein [Candidatus Poribacteria bacterium]
MSKQPLWLRALICGLLALPVCSPGQQVEELLDIKPGTAAQGQQIQAQKKPLRERPGKKDQPAEKPGAQKGPAGKGKAPAKGPQKAAKGGKSSAGSSKGGISGGIKVVTNPNNLKLRLLPEGGQVLQDIDVVEGTEFSTDVVLVNPVGRGVDKLRVVLTYSPAFLSPLSVNDTPILDRISGKPTAIVDRHLGQIVYEAALAKPVSLTDAPLLFVKWKALKPVNYTPIEFGETRDGRFTELYAGEQPILGEQFLDGDGTLSASVRVISSDPELASQMQEDAPLYMGTEEQAGGVQLRLAEPDSPPRAGEVFTMDVVLDNSVYSMLDGVSLVIEYDPAVIEVLDSDRDNWITHGPNILDGPFHAAFPFDYHMANSFYPRRGLIEYRAGSSRPEDLVGVSGTFARIVARGKAPARSTSVRFVFSKTPGKRTTEVVFLGQDVLGKTDIRNDGARGATFAVLPRQAP